MVLRITEDPAPRFLYCFESADGGKTVEAPSLVLRVEAGDIRPDELIIGGAIACGPTGTKLKEAGASVLEGVKAAIGDACKRIDRKLNVKE